MTWFSGLPRVFLYLDVVDFRKAVNGLYELVVQELEMNPYDECLFVFCNRGRDKVKILYWDKTGFALWYKRLEKARFKWPKSFGEASLELDNRMLNWLLSGLPIDGEKPHKTLVYEPL